MKKINKDLLFKVIEKHKQLRKKGTLNGLFFECIFIIGLGGILILFSFNRFLEWLSAIPALIFVCFYMVRYFNNKLFFLDIDNIFKTPVIFLTALICIFQIISGPSTCKNYYEAKKKDSDKYFSEYYKSNFTNLGAWYIVEDNQKDWEKYKEKYKCFDLPNTLR